MFFLSSSNSSDPPLEMFIENALCIRNIKENFLLLIGNYVGKGNNLIELGTLQVKLTSIFMVLHSADE